MTAEEALRADPTGNSAELPRAPTKPKGVWLSPWDLLITGFALIIVGAAGVFLIPDPEYQIVFQSLGVSGCVVLFGLVVLLDIGGFVK